MKLFFPNVFQFKQLPSFFSEFVQLNKENESFSHRQFASLINWPLGLLSDVIANRRTLTPQRCIEFSSIAKFTSLELERFLLLSIKNSIPKNHKDFLENNSSMFSSQNNTYLENEDCREIVYSFESVILAFSVWARGKMTIEKLRDSMPTFYFSEDDFEKIVSNLISKGLISIDPDGTVQVLKKVKVVLDEHTREIDDNYPGLTLHKKYAESFIDYCNKPFGPACYNSGIVEIPTGHFNEYANKVISLREWFVQRNEENKKLKKEKIEDSKLYQLDLNLFSISKIQKNNI